MSATATSTGRSRCSTTEPRRQFGYQRASRPLQDAIREYIDHIRIERNLSVRTCYTYGSWLRNFQGWLDSNLRLQVGESSVSDLTTVNLRAYNTHLKNGLGYRPRTIRTVFNSVRGLCAYLTEIGELPENPALPIKTPKLDAAERQHLTDSEVAALMTVVERQADPKKVALHKAALSVLVYGALRRAEVTALRVSDVDYERGSITIRHGKGDKRRVVFPHPDCLQAVREYVTEYRPKDAKSDYLLLHDRNKHVSEAGLSAIVRHVAAIAGYTGEAAKKWQCHSLRHNAATRMLRQGADIRSVQAVLGHTSLKTTAIYLHSDEERLKEIAVCGGLHAAPLTPAAVAPTVSPQARSASNPYIGPRYADRDDERRRARLRLIQRR